MRVPSRVAIGSIAGAIVAALVAPVLRPLFSVPAGGIGYVTVQQYPKGWDYAVITLLFLSAFGGGLIGSWRHVSSWREPAGQNEGGDASPRRATVWLVALTAFMVMLLAHDHPYAIMDMFHEGEHLVPGSLMRGGARPYADIFVLHGLAADGGLDALVLGHEPSPRRVRRLETVLDAAALAFLAAIAAEICRTGGGMAAATLLSLAAMGAGQVRVFPYFRLLPLLIAVFTLLRYARSGRIRSLFVAISIASLGILWSVDTGTYALAATLATTALILLARLQPLRATTAVACVAGVLCPVAVLVLIGADLRHFFSDSFLIIPRAIDAVWSLPALPLFGPKPGESFRYYVPPVLYGSMLALATALYRRGERLRAAQIAIVSIFAIVLFRTAAGRVSWSHTRFAAPFIGVIVIAFIVEPLVRSRRWLPAGAMVLAAAMLFEVPANIADGARLITGWRGRQRHEGQVPYPFATGKGIYTSQQDSADLAALNGYVASLGPKANFLDFSGERALYYLLQRKPPLRCPDINMLSSPPLLAEAMAELNAHPPSCVIIKGTPELGNFDGVSNAQRVPDLARWIDANYPRRIEIGRFTVAAK